MKGDYSRISFDEKNNFNSVLKQQGRVSLDADWNELVDIIKHHRRKRTEDIIGACGVPRYNGGFQIINPNTIDEKLSNQLLITSGRYYVDGLLCESYPCGRIPIIQVMKPIRQVIKNRDNELYVQVQLEKNEFNEENIRRNPLVMIYTLKHPKGIFAMIKNIKRKDRTLELVIKEKGFSETDIENLKSEKSPQLCHVFSIPKKPYYSDTINYQRNSERIDLVFLDVFEKHITAIEEPKLREIALGGSDTTTRIQTIWQVKTKTLPGSEQSSQKNYLDTIFESSQGALSTYALPISEPQNLCDTIQGGGYQGPENRLYRVEIHEGGELGVATFKWSRNNGSIAYEIEKFEDNKRIKLKQLGRDQVLKIKVNDWLEISGDETDLNTDISGDIVQVLKVDEIQQIITLSKDVIKYNGEHHVKVRRWDMSFTTLNPPTKTSDKAIELEHGVFIQFSGRNFKPGDYWLFAARTLTKSVEKLDCEPPFGVIHHYCPLAIVIYDQKGAFVKDCRHRFASLTEQFNLLYVGGDGQEGGPGMPLLYPLQVRVANGDLPIDGVEVIFKIEKNDIEYNDDILSISENINTSPGANLVEEVKIPTDNQGLAKCYWQLGKKSTSNKHRVRAHIENNEDQQVWFNANLNNTDFTEGIRIENVFLKRDVLAKRVLKGNVLRKDVQQQLVNDAVIEITDLWKGISIQCNQIIKPNSIQNRDEIKADINPICYVTLEIPYSIKTILFYLPLKIPATVDIDKENGRVINWKPVHDFKKIIIQPVNKINKKNPLSPTTHLLAHLTIKGNYIYDVNRQFILDGESFSKLNGTRSIEMPSGDGRKGGDFWMWFWINLKKEPIKPFGNNILKVGPNG